jgi:hypothetical protein
VFIESPDPPELVSEFQKGLEALLAKALNGRGFVVTQSPEGSDAIVKVSWGQTLVVDAPMPDPPSFEVDAELKANALGVHWKTSFGLASRAESAVVTQQAVQRVADRLFQAWKESAVRAGKLTKSQAKRTERIPR